MMIPNALPELVVVDNFLADPDAVRALALRQSYHASPYHKGFRTDRQFFEHLAPSPISVFAKLLGREIVKFIEHNMCGTFQWCPAETPIVQHCDLQTHAAILYLTPDAPACTGTTLLRSRQGQHRKCVSHQAEVEMFGGGFYDRTRWEEVDRIGNLYNRLVLWDARLAHAASGYFGQTVDDARLFQMFFFDCE